MYGLVKNMLFTLREVIVLLQVEKTLYQILLRRCFNINTKSQVVNDKKGDQTVNITCSNIGIEVVLSTYRKRTLSRKMDIISNFH